MPMSLPISSKARCPSNDDAVMRTAGECPRNRTPWNAKAAKAAENYCISLRPLRPLRSIVTFAIVLSSIGGSACQGRNLAETAAAQSQQAGAAVPLQNRDGSFKFAVLGDFGTGAKPQYELAAQMASLHGRFKYQTVVLVGDNLYGSERPQDFQKKFEIPYKPLLDAGVKFYASLGNHDAREQRYYKLFNMDGKLYYSFSPKADIRFFALESTYPEPEQIRWAEKELASSTDKWKIVFFHHPLYSSGERHGSDTRLRDVLEPLFLKYGVSLVLTGHDHFYERVKPQKGITYFVVGSGGQLREGNIDRQSGLTANGLDTDLVFMAAEIAGDEMYFNAISRTGATIDSGVVRRRETPR
jgi:Calcineurin-like phosphoesterase